MKRNENLIGTSFVTNEGYSITVIDYINKNNVLISFDCRPDYQVWSTSENIKKGELKFPFKPTVYERGYYGVGVYTSRINNKKTPQYVKCFSMFNRCYDERVHEKQPKYIGCEVSKEFWNFQNFAQWYDKKIYQCSYPLELDKDLLIEGNKIYSPSTCCFIPKEINIVINYRRQDKKRMRELYEKYKKEVPFYVREALYKLSK